MATVASLLKDAEQRLAACSPTARLDAEVLLAAALGRERSWLFTWPEKEPDGAVQERFAHWLARREQGEPVAHVLGRREFFGHSFRVTADTLIPRPDTETLVELALARLPQAQPLVLADLGTGTGAIAISLALACPVWKVLAADRLEAAVALADDNRQALGATNVWPLQSDWLAAIDGPLDAIVANPPYVAEQDPHLDQGDVRFEPRSALVSGADGLDDIRLLVEQAPAKLVPGGWLMLEHGHDQGAPVRALFEAAGYQQVETVADLGGNDRVTLGRRPL